MRLLKAPGALLLLFLLGLAAGAAEITGKREVPLQHTVQLQVSGILPKGGAVWRVRPLDGQDLKGIEWISGRKGPAIRWIGPEGRYEVTCTLASIDKDGTLDLDMADTVVVIGKPIPPGPGPGPGPKPPEPKPPEPKPPDPPKPDPPIPGTGLQVLMLYDAAKITELSGGQQGVLQGKPVRDYLEAKCPPGPIAGQKEYWIVDKDTDMSALDKKWGNAQKRPKTAMPWIIISNGVTGYEGPLPKNSEEALELLKKYGG